MTPPPPRSLAELTVWAASHPGGAADEIKRLRDGLEALSQSACEILDTLDQAAAGMGYGYERVGDFFAREVRPLCEAIVALASFSDRPDERNQT